MSQPGEISGADLPLFLAVARRLDEKYPRRAATADINEFLPLLIQLERLYAALPEVQPRECEGATL